MICVSALGMLGCQMAALNVSGTVVETGEWEETTVEETKQIVAPDEPQMSEEVTKEPDVELNAEPETSTEAEPTADHDPKRNCRGDVPAPEKKVLEMEPILQNPELPTGCESVALTIALKYLGFELEKTTIAEDYLVYHADNYARGYVGDPTKTDGAGVFAPGLVDTANAYLEEHSLNLRAYDVSGADFESLYDYIDAECPVLIWTTIGYVDPQFTGKTAMYQGRIYRWYRKEHCVVLSGYDLRQGTVTICDPLQGEIEMDAQRIQEIYEAAGSHAMTIH